MPKGRKLPTSRSERFLGSLAAYNHGHGTANGAAEFGEADVWSVGDDAAYGGDHAGNGQWSSPSNGGYGGFHLPPRGADHHQLGGLSLAFDGSGVRGGTSSSQRIVHQYRQRDGGAAETPRGRHVATSAPVNVPDWSKIYRVDSVESLHDSDDGFYEPELVPPHEYLAREYERSSLANSVFVGVGRTLKGRDLSRVRDAVWSQTGFDG